MGDVFYCYNLYMNEKEIENLKEFLNKNEIPFNNINIFISAFTHSSYSNESFENPESYKRLELVGDAILDYAILDHLFHVFPKLSVGEMDDVKKIFVQAEYLNKLAEDLNLIKLIKFGNGFQYNHKLKKIHGSVIESLIGAIHEDSGIEEAKKFIDKFFIKKEYI